jgi:hypothetical protein
MDTAVFYFDANIGFPDAPGNSAVSYFDLNVGFPIVLSPVGLSYFDVNVGLGAFVQQSSTHAFDVNIGIDSTDVAQSTSHYFDTDIVLPYLSGPKWVEAVSGEVAWEPGLIYNGCDFVRYHMWDGNCWQASTVEAEEQIFPTAVSVNRWSNNGVTSAITLPAFPVGMTSAVAVIATAAATTINVPAGWSLLGSTQVLGATGGGGPTSNIRRCIAVAIDNPTGIESKTFTLSNLVGDSYNGGAYATAYFTGGKPGGMWIANKGEEISHSSQGRFPPVTIVDGGPNLWWQAGIITAIYTSFVAPPGVLGSSNGFVEPWIYPNSASGENFRSTFLNARPYFWPDFIDTNSIGAYGSPCSTSWGFKWTPPTVC